MATGTAARCVLAGRLPATRTTGSAGPGREAGRRADVSRRCGGKPDGRGCGPRDTQSRRYGRRRRRSRAGSARPRGTPELRDRRRRLHAVLRRVERTDHRVQRPGDGPRGRDARPVPGRGRPAARVPGGGTERPLDGRPRSAADARRGACALRPAALGRTLRARDQAGGGRIRRAATARPLRLQRISTGDAARRAGPVLATRRHCRAGRRHAAQCRVRLDLAQRRRARSACPAGGAAGRGDRPQHPGRAAPGRAVARRPGRLPAGDLGSDLQALPRIRRLRAATALERRVAAAAARDSRAHGHRASGVPAIRGPGTCSPKRAA